MFSNKSKKPQNKKVMERNVLAKNTKIVGDIKSDGDFRIDGTLEGTLVTKGRVIIGADGFVKGKVECTNADIEGKYSGEPFGIKYTNHKNESKYFWRGSNRKTICRARSYI